MSRRRPAARAPPPVATPQSTRRCHRRQPRRRRPDDCGPIPRVRAAAPPPARTSGIQTPGPGRARRGAPASTLTRGPPVRADERHEANRRHFAHLELIALPPRDDELLLFLVADRNDQASALRELIEQRLRHARRARANED